MKKKSIYITFWILIIAVIGIQIIIGFTESDSVMRIVSPLLIIYIALFALLFKSKHTRLASGVFVLCYVLFLVMHNLFPNGYTYVSSGTAHLFIFMLLVKQNCRVYFSVSILSICLIFKLKNHLNSHFSYF